MSQQNNNAATNVAQHTAAASSAKEAKSKDHKIGRSKGDKVFKKNSQIPALMVTMNRNPTGGHEFDTRITNQEPMVTAVTNVIIGRSQMAAQALWQAAQTQGYVRRLLYFATAVKLAYTSEYIDVGGSPIVSLLRKVDISIPDCVKGFVDGIGAFTLEHARFRVRAHLLQLYTAYYRAIGPFIDGFNNNARFYIPRLNFSTRVVRDRLYSEYSRSFDREFNIVIQHNGVDLNLGTLKLPIVERLNQDYLQYLVLAGFQVGPVQGVLAALVALDTGVIGDILQDVDLPILLAAGVQVIDIPRQVHDVAYNNFLNDVYQRDSVMSSIFVMTKISGFEKDGSPGQLLSLGQGISCPFNLSADDLSYGYLIGADCQAIDYNELQHNIMFDTYTSNQLLMKYVNEDKANGR